MDILLKYMKVSKHINIQYMKMILQLEKRNFRFF